MTDVIGAHLVGSAPVNEPGEFFALAGAHLGDHLCRVSDGEVGERDAWIRWQYPRLGQCPQLTPEVEDTGYLGRKLEQYVVKEGAGPIELVELGYAQAAIDSWPLFQAAKSQGHLRPDTRFMVGLPSPLSVVTMYVAPGSREVVLDAWARAMRTELQAIIGAIPSDELAIQWEVCIEFGMLEGIWTYLDGEHNDVDTKQGIGDFVVSLGDLVPPEVELGYHLCYGDSGHEHFAEPATAGHLAWMTSTLIDRVARPIQWIHLPVPRDRDDAEYFAPLAEVTVPDQTELYLGLVHQTGGEDATRRRIAAASTAVPRFGVATECGLGRRPLESIGALLDQHAAVSAPHRA